MLSCFVIIYRSTQTRKKSNRHLLITTALYFNHVTLCENECICFLKIITLLFLCSFRIQSFNNSFTFVDNTSKIVRLISQAWLYESSSKRKSIDRLIDAFLWEKKCEHYKIIYVYLIFEFRRNRDSNVN